MSELLCYGHISVQTPHTRDGVSPLERTRNTSHTRRRWTCQCKPSRPVTGHAWSVEYPHAALTCSVRRALDWYVGAQLGRLALRLLRLHGSCLPTASLLLRLLGDGGDGVGAGCGRLGRCLPSLLGAAARDKVEAGVEGRRRRLGPRRVRQSRRRLRWGRGRWRRRRRCGRW